jgi:hypothetical protein
MYATSRPLLWAFMVHFQSSSKVSLEGDLKKFELLGRSDASTEETPELKRNTSYPPFDFVVLPITADLTTVLKKSLSDPEIFGQDGALVHVQIEHEGKLVFGAYDNFHKDCVVAHESVPEELLAKLHGKRILRAYQKVK